MPDGWDGPVEIIKPGTVNWARDAKTLAALIQDSAPIGDGPNAGTLRKDLSMRRAGYKRLPAPRAGFSLLVHNSYAKIQDEGGDVPERRATGAANSAASPFPRPAGLTVDTDGGEATGTRTIRAMRWQAAGGYVFARRARGFHLAGHNYLDTGLARWLKTRGHGGAEVAWVPATGGRA